MKARFHNILVPVDFTINTDLALAKAFEMSQGELKALHLFHVQRMAVPSFLKLLKRYIAGYSRRQMNEDRQLLMERLEQVRDRIKATHGDIPIYISASFGDPVE